MYYLLKTRRNTVYKSRQEDHPNSDIWDVSRNWDQVKPVIRERLLTGTYLLSPMRSFKTKTGYVGRYDSQDTIVLNALSIELSAIIKDKRIINIIQQYLNRCDILDGEHRLITRGIPMGCSLSPSLSPLMGALALKSLDAVIEKGCAYVRYMDDWVILLKTRRALRRMVKKMHGVIEAMKFKLAKDKTFIGKISRGFDFLGYRFSDQGLIGLAAKTIQNFLQRISMLYELKADAVRLSGYVKNWVGWVGSGLGVR